MILLDRPKVNAILLRLCIFRKIIRHCHPIVERSPFSSSSRTSNRQIPIVEQINLVMIKMETELLFTWYVRVRCASNSKRFTGCHNTHTITHDMKYVSIDFMFLKIVLNDGNELFFLEYRQESSLLWHVRRATWFKVSCSRWIFLLEKSDSRLNISFSVGEKIAET